MTFAFGGQRSIQLSYGCTPCLIFDRTARKEPAAIRTSLHSRTGRLHQHQLANICGMCVTADLRSASAEKIRRGRSPTGLRSSDAGFGAAPTQPGPGSGERRGGRGRMPTGLRCRGAGFGRGLDAARPGGMENGELGAAATPAQVRSEAGSGAASMQVLRGNGDWGTGRGGNARAASAGEVDSGAASMKRSRVRVLP